MKGNVRTLSKQRYKPSHQPSTSRDRDKVLETRAICEESFGIWQKFPYFKLSFDTRFGTMMVKDRKI
jgi:hypothetical protein